MASKLRTTAHPMRTSAATAGGNSDACPGSLVVKHSPALVGTHFATEGINGATTACCDDGDPHDGSDDGHDGTASERSQSDAEKPEARGDKDRFEHQVGHADPQVTDTL